jgi:hypothetical protein
MKLLIMQFSKTLRNFLQIKFKYFPVLKRTQSMFSFNVRDQISHPYRTTDTIPIIIIIIICIRADSVIGYWLLSSALKQTKNLIELQVVIWGS